MILCDVNVLVNAFREDAKDHELYKDWLLGKLNGEEPVCHHGVIDSGFIRIVTHQRIFQPPSDPELAFQFLRDIRGAANAAPIDVGARHWEIFERLCGDASARGNLVPDAYIAALAIEAGATLYSADRGFARFPGLRWIHPLDE
ncbi:type II toxin-antitoxin system VapC family toxin [Streptomyces sp. KLOTTS4A1]|uniref:type II toxin-antitoxin system VapC family toxin n=1 Tax=Streptomyces sp. KLOTTS4A1 TaxID=3390996 RepID=UPI0039F623D7